MEPSENKVAHILIIRLSAMGDVAMTVPVLTALYNKYPNVKITFLTRPFFIPIFEQLPNVNIYPVDIKGKHKGVYGLWRLYKELKLLNIDAVADLHNVLRSNILKRFFSFSSVPFLQINKGRNEKKELTAMNINKSIKSLKTTHERYAVVFKKLGYSLDLSTAEPVNRIAPSKKLEEFIGDASKVKIGIAPFAAYPAKMYPLDLMEKVIGELSKSKNVQLFLFGGGKAEIEKLKSFASQFDRTKNCAGVLSFREELALISNLDVMLAMDSGNGHLAAVYGIPILTLWGATHPYAGFSPYNYGRNKELLADRKSYPLIPTSIYGNKAPEGYDNAIASISPTNIVQSINSILDVI